MSATARVVPTERMDTFIREAGDPSRQAVVLVHGNVSSGVFFEEVMDALADDLYVVAPDLRGYGGSERKAIDATRGMGDFADDLYALVEALGLSQPLPFLGWSTGGGVIMQLAIDHPDAISSLVLESPMSPHGFGGTKDVEGTPVYDDFAGSGAGTANPEFVQALADGERGVDSPVTPLSTMRAFYVKTGFEFDSALEEKYLDGMLSTSIGEDVYPGDLATSENWPGVAPGVTGMNNALSPKYVDLSGFGDLDPAPPVLWIRGDSDQIVSDTSFFDLGTLGQMGLVPGWPGEEVFPSQPMVSQMRAVLEKGDNFTELVYPDCGHSPHIELPDRFLSDVTNFWR